METSPVHLIPPQDPAFCSCCDGSGTVAEGYFHMTPKFTGVVFTGKRNTCPGCNGNGVSLRACEWRKAQLEPVDSDAIPYLQALEGAGDAGFAPMGWLYGSVMLGLCEKRFAYSDSNRHFRLTITGMKELEKHARNEAKRDAWDEREPGKVS